MAFSGWAMGSGYAASMGADYAFPLSDHCDYPELLRLVEDISPELVFTTHVFADAFARDLKKRGFSASALGRHQSSLSEFASD